MILVTIVLLAAQYKCKVSIITVIELFLIWPLINNRVQLSTVCVIVTLIHSFSGPAVINGYDWI